MASAATRSLARTTTKNHCLVCLAVEVEDACPCVENRVVLVELWRHSLLDEVKEGRDRRPEARFGLGALEQEEGWDQAKRRRRVAA